ncbi:MAG: hypothetical protein U0Q16_30105 [Bryobacteraceae bacterium]
MALVIWSALLTAAMQQNPSPMVEHTRVHGRLKQFEPAGQRFELDVGTLWIPKARRPGRVTPLTIHFHGTPWIAEQAGASLNVAVLAVNIGVGSAVYAEPFRDPEAFRKLLGQAEEVSRRHFPVVTLSSWSAGYGAIRQILRNPENWARIDRVVTLDSIHAGYPGGKPGPEDSEIAPNDMEPFEMLAREAVRGRKRFLITHTEVFPGTFASTTETADYLIAKMGLKRKPVLKWGPVGTQQLSETRKGRFAVLGFAGNTAPDHLDQIHGLATFWRMIR